MSTGLEIYQSALELNQKECERQIELKDPVNAFIYFMNYLNSLFALRENKELKDSKKGKKDDTIFGALKNIYEAIKHKNDADEVVKINVFIYGRSYPYAYPYNYGKSKIIFGDIDKIADFQRKSKDKEDMIELHKKHLKGKTVTAIMDMATKETISEGDNNG